MSKSSRRGSFGSFRGKIAGAIRKQRSMASNYGHLLLPRGLNVFKEERGKTITFDILPYIVKDRNHTDRDDVAERAVEGSLWYRRPYMLHRYVGFSKVTAICLASFGRKCPICEYRDELVKKDKLDWKDKRVQNLRPSRRNLYYMIPNPSLDATEKPQLWDVSGYCFQDLLNEEVNENEEFDVFPGLDDGLTLKVRFREDKTGDGKRTFAKASKIEFVPRNDYNYDIKVVEALTSLDDILDVKDYKTLERMFFETEADADEIVEDDDDFEFTPPDDGDENQADDGVGEEEDEEPQETHRRHTNVITTSRPRLADGGSATVTAMTRPARIAEPERTAKPSPAEPKKPADSSPKKTAAGTCPYGYKFGVDVDSKDECEECPSATWSACMDAHNEAA